MKHITTANLAPGSLPGWLKPANNFIMTLQRLGLRMGRMRVLSVPGRASGAMRSTPVTPFTYEGALYVASGTANGDWAKNARAAGWGLLGSGRASQRVRLIELSVEERIPVLRAYPRLSPTGVPFFRSLYRLPNDKAQLPDAFAALAPSVTVFRIEPDTRAG